MSVDVILLEARPRDPATGAAVVVRLAGAGGVHPYFYDGHHWRAGLTGLPTSIARLDFDGEQLGGGGVPQALAMTWAPATNDAVAKLGALYWGDAPVTLRIGPEGAGLPPVDTAGLVLDAAADRGVLSIAFADLATDLKRPLLVDRFAGTGGLEGPVEWEGQIKARAWGACFNVPGKPLLKADNIWCFGDPLRPWRAFREVRDKGVAIAPADMRVLEWQGSAAATLAALRAAVVPSGGCVVCPSIASVKWWAAPSGDPRADIEGEADGGYVATAPEIAARLVAARSTLTFGNGEVAAAAASRSAPFGRWWNSESVTAASAVSEVLGDVGLSWVIVDGAIALRPWEWSAPVRAARSVAVSRRRIVKPIATRRLGYRRNHSPMARGDLADIVLARDVAYEDGTPIEDLKPSAPGADKTSENTAKDTASIGGRPTPEVLAQLDKIEDIEFPTEAVDLLKLTIADREAAERQMQRALDLLGEAILRVTGEASIAREVMRDAGIVADPATGKVRIYAVDLLAERTTAQLTLVDQTLDAVNAAVITKVERSEFDGLATDIGFVEQVLSSAGGRSGLSFTARQARAAGNDGAEAGLRALLAGDEASRRTIVQIAEVRQEVFAKIIDASTAEAVARQLLNVQIGAVDVRLATEILTRIEDGKAVARQIAALGVKDESLAADIAKVDEARIEGDKASVRSTEVLIAASEKKTGGAIDKVDERVTDAEASIKRVSEASVKADEANAMTIQQVTARLDGVGGVTIEEKIEAVADRTGKIEGIRTIAIDINGNMVGQQLVGSAEGPGSLNLINTDLRVGTGRVIFNNGRFMMVQGTGFGRFRDLLSWYGPTMAIDDCTITNAFDGKTTTGTNKIGGLLVAGRFSNQGANTALGAREVAVLGPFGGAGGQVRVSASWLYERTYEVIYEATIEGEQSFQADVAYHGAVSNGLQWFGSRVDTVPATSIVLRRSFATGAEAILDQASFDKETSTMVGFAPQRGDAPGRADFRIQMGGGFTATDPVQSAVDRTLRLSLSRGINLSGSGLIQRLSIITIEE